jgi:ABC-type transporter Mla subunit MlaD
MGQLEDILRQINSKIDGLAVQVQTIETTMATKDDLAELEARVNQRFEQVDQRFEQVNRRFEQVNRRFERQDETLSDMFSAMNDGFQRLDGRIDELERSDCERDLKSERFDSDFRAFAEKQNQNTERITALEADVKDLKSRAS